MLVEQFHLLIFWVHLCLEARSGSIGLFFDLIVFVLNHIHVEHVCLSEALFEVFVVLQRLIAGFLNAVKLIEKLTHQRELFVVYKMNNFVIFIGENLPGLLMIKLFS